MSQKSIYCSKRIEPIIIELSPNEVRSNFHICDHSIVTFFNKRIIFRVSNTYHVDSLDLFRKSVVDKVKTDVCIKKNENHSKENIRFNMKMKLLKLGMGDPTTRVYKLIYYEKENDEATIINDLIMN